MVQEVAMVQTPLKRKEEVPLEMKIAAQQEALEMKVAQQMKVKEAIPLAKQKVKTMTLLRVRVLRVATTMAKDLIHREPDSLRSRQGSRQEKENWISMPSTTSTGTLIQTSQPSVTSITWTNVTLKDMQKLIATGWGGTSLKTTVNAWPNSRIWNEY